MSNSIGTIFRVRSPYTFHPIHGRIKNNSFIGQHNPDDDIMVSQSSNMDGMSGNINWLVHLLTQYEIKYPKNEFDIIVEVDKDGEWLSVDFVNDLNTLIENDESL